MSKEEKKRAEAASEEPMEETVAEEAAEEPEVSAVEAELSEWKDKYLRLMAEFDNYKKRTAKEKSGIYHDATANAVAVLLPVMDNLERALAAQVTSDDAKALRDGVLMVKKQLADSFAEVGVEEIEAVGKTFDPNFHNAVLHIDDEQYGENEIVEEFSKGYILGEKVIRYSMVKVAN